MKSPSLVLCLAALVQDKNSPTCIGEFLVAGAGFEPATFGLCVPTTAFAAPMSGFGVWTFSSPSVIPGGCLPLSLYTFFDLCNRSLARDYHLRGFPEFDRLSRRPFGVRSPLRNQFPGHFDALRFTAEPDELPDCSTLRPDNSLFCKKCQSGGGESRGCRKVKVLIECSRFLVRQHICRGGGMVYATDSKSVSRKGLRVRVPPAASSFTGQTVARASVGRPRSRLSASRFCPALPGKWLQVSTMNKKTY